MVKKKSRYAKARRIFLLLFLLSTLLFLLVAGITVVGVPQPEAIVVEAPAEPESPEVSSESGGLAVGGLVATVSSCLTSVTTFIGFVLTLLLEWRKEKRDARKADIESERERIELEKAKHELERMKAEKHWLEIGGVRYSVQAGGTTIGRSTDNDLHLPDDLASWHHARIELRGGVVVLTDLGSTNGTFVNEQRIQQQLLRDGDEIRIGHSRMRFHTRSEA